jgi:hypothetical protein
MDLFSDMIQATQDDLTTGDESSLFDLPLVKRALNRSKRKAYALHRWAELEDAKRTSSLTDQEYYDYPQTWQPDSMWKLKVDGVDLGDPLTYHDYLYETENDFPSGKNSIWSSQWRRFFVRIEKVAPTTDGNNNMYIWGQDAGDSLVADSDTTIFSYSMPDCNEAIVLEAVAILKNKGEEEQTGQFRSLEAKQILGNAWNKIKQNQQKYVKTTPFFNVPDFFARRNKRDTNIGDF